MDTDVCGILPQRRPFGGLFILAGIHSSISGTGFWNGEGQ
jgi:hypothetical protein